MKVLATLAVAAVLASPASAITENRPSGAHARLIRTLESKGVSVRIAPRDAARGCMGKFGQYDSGRREVTVCISNDRFDARGLSTLRHEAIHVVQDCRASRLGDFALQPAPMADSYRTSRSVGHNLDARLNWYRNLGMSLNDIKLEAEAISSAEALSADQIASRVNRTCP